MTTISFPCYGCGQVLRVAADKAGKRAKCPKCSTMLTIPIASVKPDAAPAKSTPDTAAGIFNMELDEAPTTAPKKPVAAPPPKQPLRVELVEDEPLPAAPLEEEIEELPMATPQPAHAVPRPPPRRPAPQPVEEFEELPPADEPYQDFEPRGRRRAQQPPAWSFVRLACLLAFIGSCVWAGAFLLKLIGYLLLSIQVIAALSGPGREASTAWMILLRVGECLSVCGSLTALVGYVFCIVGPKENGKLGMAIATTAVAGVDVLLSLIFKVPFVFSNMSLFEVGPFGLVNIRLDFGSWFMLVFCQLLFVAELILFPLYIRLVALDFRRRSHGQTAVNTMFVTGAYGLLRLFVWIFYYISLTALVAAFTMPVFRDPFTPFRPEPPRALIWITLILLWFGNLAYIGQVIWYTIFLWQSRDIVQERGRR